MNFEGAKHQVSMREREREREKERNREIKRQTWGCWSREGATGRRKAPLEEGAATLTVRDFGL